MVSAGFTTNSNINQNSEGSLCFVCIALGCWFGTPAPGREFCDDFGETNCWLSGPICFGDPTPEVE